MFTNGILDYCKIINSRFEVIVKTFNVHQAIQEVIYCFEGTIKDKGISLTNECNPSLVIESDDRLLKETIFVLIENAIKFTNKGGIRILCEDDDVNYCLFKIVDTGCGCSDDDLDSIQKVLTEPFNETKKISKSSAGLGIGLRTA